MANLLKFFSHFRSSASGATAIEYGLIAALVAVVIIGAVTTVGTENAANFNLIATSVDNAVP